MSIHLGTSGFAYSDWKPLFYPVEVAQARFLQHYATRLNSVEINYTFQRFPTETLLTGWAAKVPDGFTFSLKTPRRISHERRLVGCGDDVVRFTDAARVLGDKLGVILVQLPPTMQSDLAALDGFTALLPPDLRFAFEFRHESWQEPAVRDLLRSRGHAWVEAESDDAAAISGIPGPGFHYLRLRRNAYDDVEAASRAADIGARDGTVFGYFRHDGDGSNALVAERVRATLRPV